MLYKIINVCGDQNVYELRKRCKDADVIMFHGVLLFEQHVINVLKDMFPYFNVLKRKWFKPLSSGIVTMSKHPLKKVYSQVYKHVWGWDIFTSKGFLISSVEIEGHQVYLINTEMCSNNQRIAEKQGNEILNFVNQMKKPVIIGGELNQILLKNKYLMKPSKSTSFLIKGIYSHCTRVEQIKNISSFYLFEN